MKSRLLQTAVALAAAAHITPNARASTPLPSVTYTRGTDLSGSLEGASGIGGLLARTDSRLSTPNSPNSTVHYHSDGNGNVTALINAAQQLAAKHEYDPFGNTVSSSGTLANANLYRFSSKEIHASSGMYYYGCRFYDPSLQKWLNRDPIQESGGPNPFAFVENRPPNAVDGVGLRIWVCTVRTSGFPLYGRGTHSYFWDDSPATPAGSRECGMEKSSGTDGNTSANIGPSSKSTDVPWVRTGMKGKTECYPVVDSAGKEAKVMSCCQKNANKGLFLPYVNDCHGAVDNCLQSNGLESPPHSRAFDPISNHLKDIQKALDY